ncbi:MAG: type VI secretion system ATPase TssH [Alphaproteobacteria bacterium]|nr:type VI secretion system ATPase TssH [Alphaproteobacteria bacterium]
MITTDLMALVRKLNDVCRKSLEDATGATLSRGHYSVEIEHWLAKLLEAPDSEFSAICRHYELDAGRLAQDVARVLQGFKAGSTRTPTLAPSLVDLVRDAWLIASLDHAATKVRSGHLLCALLANEVLGRQAREASPQFARIAPDALRRDLAGIVAETAECKKASAESGARAAGDSATSVPATGGALDLYTVDLTARAREGGIDPVLGRDAEIRQIIDILLRRRQNNPILTGEAGVGKTAVVEGFALAVAAGEVPDGLRQVAVRSLDLGLLQAGAGVRGEFENRLKSVISEVKASARPIILFIDEAHTLIGAGGQAGQNDAANLLKPALARGDLRTIAATTWAEYKKYFERDAALARRFQVVKVEEPGDEIATAMLHGLVPTLEKHHGVAILDQAVTEAVRLSRRYITGRQLPDKGVSLLDTACARVAMSQTVVPAVIETLRRDVERLDRRRGILEREAAAGADHSDALAGMAERKRTLEADLAVALDRWGREKALAERAGQLRKEIQAAPEDTEAKRSELTALDAELKSVQGEAPLVHVCVDGEAVAAVVANWTGVPVGRMVSNEIRTVLSLGNRMGERIVGQPHALTVFAEAMQTSRARLTDPRKPLGVFLLVGTSGVGKTESALALADLLYGGEQNLTVINMSEFKEEHKVSLLMGSPPGYVGYGEGGVLTEAVRRRPYGIVLLDEMEKAHPGVQDVFYQVFDKGMLKDGEGRDIDFKNTVVMMTSNAGTDTIAALCKDPDTIPEPVDLIEALRPELLKVFKPAFLGRVTLVPYFPLGDAVLRQIVALQLGRIADRVRSNYNARFEWSADLVERVAARCTEVDSGARNVEHILMRNLLPALSERFLARLADGEAIKAVHVSVADDGTFTYAIN